MSLNKLKGTKGRKYNIKIRVVKTTNIEPIEFASVYDARKWIGNKTEYTIVRIMRINLIFKCIECNYTLGKGFQFCPRCGAKV